MVDLVDVARDKCLARIKLNRPERNNALSEALVEALSKTFESIAADQMITCVVLSGEGKSLCSGADIGWMSKAADYDREENIADLLPLGSMLRALDRMPQTTIAQVHGPVYGGGIGLVAACDIAIGSSGATFCFSETKLGIAPGMISPYALRAIGEREARRYFQSAEVFDAAEARRIGLLHEIVAPDALDERIALLTTQMMSSPPLARAAAKTVARDIAGKAMDDALLFAIAESIADLRAGAEAREGLAAFIEKRKPSWG